MRDEGWKLTVVPRKGVSLEVLQLDYSIPEFFKLKRTISERNSLPSQTPRSSVSTCEDFHNVDLEALFFSRTFANCSQVLILDSLLHWTRPGLGGKPGKRTTKAMPAGVLVGALVVYACPRGSARECRVSKPKRELHPLDHARAAKPLVLARISRFKY